MIMKIRVKTQKDGHQTLKTAPKDKKLRRTARPKKTSGRTAKAILHQWMATEHLLRLLQKLSIGVQYLDYFERYIFKIQDFAKIKS